MVILPYNHHKITIIAEPIIGPILQKLKLARIAYLYGDFV